MKIMDIDRKNRRVKVSFESKDELYAFIQKYKAHLIAEALTLETFGELESEKAKEFYKNAEEMLEKSKTN